MRYRSWRVFSLGGWHPQLPSTLGRGTQELPEGLWISPTRLSLSLADHSRSFGYPLPSRSGALQPGEVKACALLHPLGFSAFARRYLRNHNCFLLLRLLGCFRSPSSPPDVASGYPAKRGGFPHSETAGSPVARHLPDDFADRSVLHRPSKPRHPLSALLKACEDGSIHFSKSNEVEQSSLHCGPKRVRTADLPRARRPLFQLSYRPHKLKKLAEPAFERFIRSSP
jgi:hypothetical protein